MDFPLFDVIEIVGIYFLILMSIVQFVVLQNNRSNEGTSLLSSEGR
jgi:hypothetical protein